MIHDPTLRLRMAEEQAAQPFESQVSQKRANVGHPRPSITN